MSDLAHLEKRQFERLLQMGRSYVLNFSNGTFAEFVTDSVGRDIWIIAVLGSANNQTRGIPLGKKTGSHRRFDQG